MIPSDYWRTTQHEQASARQRKVARDAFHGVVYMLAIFGLGCLVGQLCSGCASQPRGEVTYTKTCPYDVGCFEQGSR